MATIRDIAKKSGYNVGTVSRALRGDKARVSENAIETINQIANELGYDPQVSHMARRMIQRRFGIKERNNVIAVLLPSNFSSMPYFFAIYQGILNVLSAENYGVLTAYIGEKAGLLPSIFARDEIDALIATASLPSDFCVKFGYNNALTEHRFPLVTVRSTVPGVPSVWADESHGAYLAARHLLDKGHRHLLHFLDRYPSSPALSGYQQACRDVGLNPDNHLHGWHFDAWNKDENATDWVWDILCQAFSKYPAITGIMALNDVVAIQIYKALLIEGGIQVPRDISLVGYDDTHVITDVNQNNILTTIHLPLREIGEISARMTLDILNGKIKPDEKVILPVSLIERASTRTV